MAASGLYAGKATMSWCVELSMDASSIDLKISFPTKSMFVDNTRRFRNTAHRNTLNIT